MKVSLVVTVLNEGDHVRRLLDSVLAQSRPPDEVVVCDGGSRDHTLAVIGEYAGRLPLKLLSAPGANISQGRNTAIRQAAGDVIAVTDAGVWLEAVWLEALMRAIENAGQAALAAGFYQSDPQTSFEVALGATTLPDLSEIDPARFLPSSRSAAFRKTAWQAVGGYPEWLDFSEDVVFDLALRKQFGPFAFAPGAIAHFRPRKSLGAFARQYFNYARGDGRAALWPRIHFIRYFTYLVAAPLLIYAALTVSPLLWLAGLAAGLAYLRRPVQRLARARQLSPITLFWIPVIRVTGDLAKMLGYPVGVLRRLAHRP
jgi:glycosyltransferase involved in cell wall biosynthesis